MPSTFFGDGLRVLGKFRGIRAVGGFVLAFLFFKSGQRILFEFRRGGRLVGRRCFHGGRRLDVFHGLAERAGDDRGRVEILFAFQRRPVAFSIGRRFLLRDLLVPRGEFLVLSGSFSGASGLVSTNLSGGGFGAGFSSESDVRLMSNCLGGVLETNCSGAPASARAPVKPGYARGSCEQPRSEPNAFPGPWTDARAAGGGRTI